MMEAYAVVRGILASGLMLFLPGFAWSFVLFRNKSLNRIERIVVSIGLSIALSTLGIMAMNLVFGVRISTVSILITLLVLTTIPAVLFFVLWYRARHPQDRS